MDEVCKVHKVGLRKMNAQVVLGRQSLKYCIAKQAGGPDVRKEEE